MAKPRIFICSTFYDLKQLRDDLRGFIIDIGYEPVLHELGNITYGKDHKLEEYCYKEIESCDILVGIIGGKYGSESQNNDYSITQMEIKTALKSNKQVYLFIEKNVFYEYKTYQLNKDKDIKYDSVDNTKIFEFIEEICSLEKNNLIYSFETSKEIVNILKTQWAGLFKTLLQEQNQLKINSTELINNTIDYAEKYENLTPLIEGEFLKNIFWDSGSEMNKTKSDLDGDGVEEEIIIGGRTPLGIKLLVTIGKETHDLTFDIKGLDEGMDLKEQNDYCQLMVKDVTNDGYPEIILAFTSGFLEIHLNIWKYDKEKFLNTPRGKYINPFIHICHIMGQEKFILITGGKIQVPYGTRGLFDTYTWNGKKFVSCLEEFNL